MEQGRSPFLTLPDEIVLKILSLLSPYGDLSQAKQVCKRWKRVVTIIIAQDLNNFNESILTGAIQWTKYPLKSDETLKNLFPGLRAGVRQRGRMTTDRPTEVPLPSARFSLCACRRGDFMYVFGGCSPSNIALNDMYILDLRTRCWRKIDAKGILPSPRECCTMVSYHEQLIIFGGWCQPRRIDLAPRFFNHLHLFDITTNTWSTIEKPLQEGQPSERAGHNASITKQKMIIFGGAQRNQRFDDVWVLNLKTWEWSCPSIRGAKPQKRFGHSQFVLNEDFIFIIGGCGGPDMLFSDAWLLNTCGWIWTEINVRNRLCEPPLLWCHPGVRVNDQIVIFSEQRNCKDCVERKQASEISSKMDEHLCAACESPTTTNQPAEASSSQMQMYVFDGSKCVLGHYGSWRNIPVCEGSPLSRSLYSAVVGKGEIIIFGGLQNTQQHDAIQTANNSLVFITPEERKL